MLYPSLFRGLMNLRTEQEAFETTAVPSLPDAEDDEAEELI